MNLIVGFLMHRVELKDGTGSYLPAKAVVPNAPCGVERFSASDILLGLKMFLMHRVELKVFLLVGNPQIHWRS